MWKRQISDCVKYHCIFGKAYLYFQNQFFTRNGYFIEHVNRLTSKWALFTYFRYVDRTYRYTCRPAVAGLCKLANEFGNYFSLGLCFTKYSLYRKMLQMQVADFSEICIYVIYKFFGYFMRESQSRVYVTKEIKFLLQTPLPKILKLWKCKRL